MSISDGLMWRYWTFLTDLRQTEIDQMQTEVAGGILHPMEAKKRLARTIVAGFHSQEPRAKLMRGGPCASSSATSKPRQKKLQWNCDRLRLRAVYSRWR